MRRARDHDRDRPLHRPARQALAYKLGASCKPPASPGSGGEKLGAKFDQRRFHDAILADRPGTSPPLRQTDQQGEHFRGGRDFTDQAHVALIDELLSLLAGGRPVMARLVDTGRLTLDDIKEAEEARRSAALTAGRDECVWPRS
jgi:hypothetical protein